jgi:hypothetical protein
MRLFCCAMFSLTLTTACVALPQMEVALTNQPSDEPVALPDGSPIRMCQSFAELGLPSPNLQKTHILYQAYDQQLDQDQLWVISLYDGKRTQLDGYRPSSLGLGFLQDGHNFILIHGAGDIEIGDINSAPAKQVDLTDSLLANFQAYSPIWNVMAGSSSIEASDYSNGRFHSPDNKSVASWSRGAEALVLVNQIDRREKEILSTASQDEISGMWTADSKWFVFSHVQGDNGTYSSQLFRVNAGGSVLQPLTLPYQNVYFANPLLSPDGEKALFSISEENSNLLGVLWVNSGKLRLYIINSTIGSSYLYGGSKVWSPDSEWVAFFTDWEKKDIQVMNVERGDIYCATDDLLEENLMDWR